MVLENLAGKIKTVTREYDRLKREYYSMDEKGDFRVDEKGNYIFDPKRYDAYLTKADELGEKKIQIMKSETEICPQAYKKGWEAVTYEAFKLLNHIVFDDEFVVKEDDGKKS